MTARAALVTGGSSGIGLAIARVLVEEGYVVTIAGRGAERLEQAAAALGPAANPVTADVASDDDVRRLIAAHEERFGRLDVLVNNAGGPRPAAIEDATSEVIDQQLAENLRSVYAVTREALPQLKAAAAQAGVAHVFNTASILGRFPIFPNTTAYAVAKAGVIAFTQALHRQYAEDGIKATVLSPAFTATPGTERLPIPADEMIQAADVAEAVRFVVRASRNAVVPEIRFIRPADQLLS